MLDFNALLKMMFDKSASDLFITAERPPMMKVHGKTTPVADQDLTAEQAHEQVRAIMSPAQRDTFEKTGECNFAISREGIGRFRVSAFMQRGQAGMVLRRIETRIPTVEELHLPPILKTLAMTKRGLVIFVGATGTGKSTSLASMLGFRNHNGNGHIVTVEDPIEFIHPHDGCIVTQREVGIDTDSYQVALKNTLRQAPDVILIGEIRDRETMQHAIAFAETGHLCLSTLHANNANQALDRIINFFPENSRNQLFMDLSLNLKAMVAQLLIPRANGQGRMPAVEIMINTPHIADLIRKGEVHKLKDIMKRSGNLGMKTFDQALFDLHMAGEISYDDAVQYADSANEVRLMIKLGKSDVGDLAAGMEGVTLVEDSSNIGRPMRPRG
jgi:twitching motility protein PilU